MNTIAAAPTTPLTAALPRTPAFLSQLSTTRPAVILGRPESTFQEIGESLSLILLLLSGAQPRTIARTTHAFVALVSECLEKPAMSSKLVLSSSPSSSRPPKLMPLLTRCPLQLQVQRRNSLQQRNLPVPHPTLLLAKLHRK